MREGRKAGATGARSVSAARKRASKANQNKKTPVKKTGVSTVVLKKASPASAALPFKAAQLSSLKTGPLKTVGDFEDAPRDAAKYETRYVAFIDILGFRDIITRSRRPDSDLPARIYNALDIPVDSLEQGIQHATHQSERPDLRVHSFSDCVVISSANNQSGLASILFACWRLASNWLEQGFLCRGGIANGLVTHRVDGDSAKSTLVFGPAFVEAYHLESKVADYARIVLSREVRSEFCSLRKKHDFQRLSPLIKQCDDGPHCLDSFAHIRKNSVFNFAGGPNEHDHSVAQYARHLNSHHDDSSDTPQYFRKVKWLVDEFNDAIKDTRYAGHRIEQS